MDRSWKFVIKVVSSLMIVVIVCLSVNIGVNKVTATVNGGFSQQGSNQQGNNANTDNQSYVDNGGTVADNSDVASDPTGGTVGGDTGTAVTPNGNTGNTVQQNNNNTNSNTKTNSNTSSADPTTYSKEQLVTYYNQCLKRAYSQPKFTVTKTEKIEVKLGEMKLNGKTTDSLQSMANKVVANNTKNETKTKSFTSSTAKVDAQERFILPANLYPAAVKSATVSRNGQGYVINFALNSESCDFKKKPPYNYSCTFPLDFTEIDLGGLGEITSATFYYPGTTLQATIDSQGRVVKTYVVMPLQVDNASGKGMGQTLSVNISGKWYGTNVNTF